MVIVDTTVWTDYLNGASTPEVEWLEARLTRQRLGLLDLAMCEVLQGLENDATAARVSRELRKFAVFNTGGVEFAEAAARNYRVLRSRGRTVRKTNRLPHRDVLPHGGPLAAALRSRRRCVRSATRAESRASRATGAPRVTLRYALRRTSRTGAGSGASHSSLHRCLA